MSDQATSSAPISAPTTTTTDSKAPVTNAPQKDTSGKFVTQDKAPATDKPTAAEIKKWKLKVDGREEEIDEKELVRRASLSSGAQKRMQEAANVQKAFAKLVEDVKSNPVKSLFDPALGLNKEQIRTAFENWYKEEILDPEMLSPEQRKMKEAEARIKGFEEKEANEKKQQETKRIAEMQAEHRATYDKQIFEALSKTNLPKTPDTVKRTAYYMYQALERGIEAPIEAIIDLVKQDYQKSFTDMYGQADISVLEQIFGEEFFNKLRKHDVARFKANQPVAKPTVAVKSAKQKENDTSTSMLKVRNYFDTVK